ncbi:hypothetical protein Tco_0289086, partial [Tanacetum coccineum]
QTLLLDVRASVTPKHTTPTPTPTTPPITPPTTTEAPVTPVLEYDPSTTILQRLLALEKKVVELSKVDHSEVIKESV